MSLTAAEIFAKPDQELIELQVPEWGGSVWIRSFDAGELLQIEREFYDPKTGGVNPAKGNLRVKVVLLGVCDQNGSPIFAAAEIPKLEKRNAKIMDRLATAVLGHNRMDDKSKEALKED